MSNAPVLGNCGRSGVANAWTFNLAARMAKHLPTGKDGSDSELNPRDFNARHLLVLLIFNSLRLLCI